LGTKINVLNRGIYRVIFNNPERFRKSISTGTLYTAGTYRLGGGDGGENSASRNETDRALLPELAARAALMRLTAEEEEIQQNYGCGRQDLFLPRQHGAIIVGIRSLTHLQLICRIFSN
jgi:hypothetical protein